MTWRPAPSVAAALKEADRLWPRRSRATDGILGDARHAAGRSDHNPDGRGIVHAFDLTHDPGHGVDCEKLAAHLIRVRDRRVDYLIWNRRLCNSQTWSWRPYTLPNPHASHLHVSIKKVSWAENDVSPWWNLQGECLCGVGHLTIQEALDHAHKNLGAGVEIPIWGTQGGQIANVGRVIGFESSDKRRRIRLDYDEHKGVHVNEEDSARAPTRQKICHLVQTAMCPIDSDAKEAWRRIKESLMQTYWNKWTSRYNKTSHVLETEQALDRARRGH